jgi:hypothetical protein
MPNLTPPKSGRKPISKRLRFEVFKRDSFTCQYCGAKAPDVILHADHVKPVVDGGPTNALNLITSCEACNLGKGKRRLDDSSLIQKQRSEIEALKERREQIQMMLDWRDAEQSGAIDLVDAVSDRVFERGGLSPNESGRSDIKKWLKKYSLEEILKALDDSFDYYMKFIGDKPDSSAWNLAFKKIPATANIIRQEKTKPNIRRILYIQGIMRRRFDEPYEDFVEKIEHCISLNWSLDDLEDVAKLSLGWKGMVKRLNDIAKERRGGN